MTGAASGKLYLMTPRLAAADVEDFAATFSDVLGAGAGSIASALVRIAAGSEGDAKKIAVALIEAAQRNEVALLVESDARLAARIGADGVHINGAGTDLTEALASLKPDRIVGAGLMRGRDDAMSAGEAGADYVMFGEPRPDGFTPPAEETLERVAWWAEIFEPPCVGYAGTLEEIAPLIAAGADFVALGDALWQSPSPAATLLRARTLLAPPAR